jgi:hypothetical protein
MSKSLGTLTLDLVAKTGGFVAGMTKAERESEKFRKKVKKDLQQIGKEFAMLSGAAAAALGALTVASVQSAVEVTRLAQVAGTSTREFQKYAAGASALGIQQDKLADIFKDTADKVGDFLQTGGGPLADFFEKIAPQVGVTAEQFRNLSGPQALGLYVSSLEKANISQNEMTFFMEAIASDATLLLPLLRNNAAGFELLGQKAEEAGAIMSDDMLDSATKLNVQMGILKLSLEGAKNEIASELIPAIVTLVTELDKLSESGAAAEKVAEGIGTTFRWVAAAGIGFAAALEMTGQRFGGLAAIIAAIPRGLGAVRDTVAVIGEDLDATAQKYATAIRTILDADSAPQTSDIVNQIAEVVNQANTQTGAASNDALVRVLDTLKEIEVTASKISIDESIVKLAETQSAANAGIQSVADSLATQEELIRQSYERRKQIILDNTLVTGEAQKELLTRLTEQTNEELNELNMGFWDKYLQSLEEQFMGMDELTANMLENLTSRFGDAFEAMIFDSESLGDAVYKLADGMLRSIVNALGQMAGQWIAYQAVQLATGQSTQAAVTATSAASGAAIASAYAPAAAMASLASFGANSAPAMAGITATASLAKGLSLVGMAHDGIDSVPQTGTWLLQKGERVTTADTSAKLDKTLSSIEGGGGMGKNIRIVNAWDSSMIGDYMGSSSGEEVIMNAVRRNQRTIRSLAS